MFSFQIIKIKDQLESNSVKLQQTTLISGTEAVSSCNLFYFLFQKITVTYISLSGTLRNQCVIVISIFFKEFLRKPIVYTGLLCVKSLNLNVIDFSFGFQ